MWSQRHVTGFHSCRKRGGVTAKVCSVWTTAVAHISRLAYAAAGVIRQFRSKMRDPSDGDLASKSFTDLIAEYFLNTIQIHGGKKLSIGKMFETFLTSTHAYV